MMDGIYLINIAGDAIREVLENRRIIDRDKLLQEHPELRRETATFVTLELNHNLRGCIGSLVARRSLLDDIVANAKAAAFEDPRFLPLSRAEFDSPVFHIEISLLSEPRQLYYESIDELYGRIRPGIDGVILKHGVHQATYLPQVWEQLSHVEDFFSSLCQNAGMSGSCLRQHPEIYTYEVKKITK